MESLRLLGKLSAYDLSDDQRRQQQSQDLTLNSIRKYITNLLNTTRGSVPIDPNFGVPNFSSGPGSAQAMPAEKVAKIILEQIKNYEPRIYDTKVEVGNSSADNLSMGISIFANIISDEKKRMITISGLLLADGSFTFDLIG
ncbi:type VI secretion system baseplate subunit TssE [Colwellia sp. MB02u-10]|uniref:type VI secretion system baseplate subunit TssE n=1 Tax=Colwellia sp. MB02u-10 TaxID=2759828 RepID=UPI0015F4B66F|nr:type VI secretion system baseplate subunit TssE [Colwellia sp. MB02u-10]MBA6339754.1 type VI secretion system baseplate subunit TssE [Colwellia sp. MB02u-10]